MALHHVCFPYLERGWSGWDILILVQAGIVTENKQSENKTCLDHDHKCYLLHILALKPMNVLYKVQNQDNVDL